ncbi:MAG: hypothetical protein RBQ66_08615 [Candidatus Cloacimonadaceae bacterium]|nr:hypothetical protein [Candidatus Cloacimonadaceae bacterium]
MSTCFHRPDNVRINAGCTDRGEKYYVLAFDDDSGNDVKLFFVNVESLRIIRDSLVNGIDVILREEENAVAE